MVWELEGENRDTISRTTTKWARHVVKALGVYFSSNEEQARQLNFCRKN